VLSFSYIRSPAVPGGRQLHSVLGALTVTTSGYDPLTYTYSYGKPTLHSQGQFLVGFDQVVRRGALTTETTQFLNGDYFTSLPTTTWTDDQTQPKVSHFAYKNYEDSPLFGLAHKRVHESGSGWSTSDSVQQEVLFEQVIVDQYEDGYCPSAIRAIDSWGTLTTETQRAHPANLPKNLTCLAGAVTRSGSHSDPSLDFRYDATVRRNEIGQLEEVDLSAGTTTLPIQTVTYFPDYKVETVSVPGHGTVSATYDPKTGQTTSVTQPDGVIARVEARDPVTDAILALTADRGTMLFRQSYAFDGQERLQKQWSNLGQASATAPNALYTYSYATATQLAYSGATVLFDAANAGRVTTTDFYTGAGEQIAEAQRIPQGWSFDSVLERSRSTRTTTRLVRPTIAGDVAGLGYAALLSGGTTIDVSQKDVFGDDVTSTDTFHAGVSRNMTTALAIDGASLRETSTENGTYVTTRWVDEHRRLLRHRDEAGTEHAYLYDALGRLRKVTLPDATTHRVSYDAFGRVSRVDRDNVASVVFGYDPKDDLLTSKQYLSPSGVVERTVAYTYDAAGRTKNEVHTTASPAATKEFDYFYDGATPESPTAKSTIGLLTGERGPGYEKLFTYRFDGSPRARTITFPGWRSFATSWTYDEDGEIRAQTLTVEDAHGATLLTSTQAHQRDAYGRQATITEQGATLANLTYDGNNLPATAAFTNGTTVTLAYDPVTRFPTGHTVKTTTWSSSTSQRRNDRAFIDSESLAVGATSVQRQYGYSPEGYLASSKDALASYAYTFDTNGLSSTITTGTQTLTVKRTGSTLTSGQRTHTFDALGRAVGVDAVAVTYGPDGQIDHAQQGARAWSYVHDGSGTRLVKAVAGAPVAAYLPEGYYDGTYLYEPLRVANRLVGVLRNGVFQALPTDARGTVLADQNGTARLPSPFGDRATHPDLAAALDFVEHGYDADLGTIRLGVRDYDAKLERFLTPDPLYLEQPERCITSQVDCNLYTYARNNPLLFLDPSGMDPSPWLQADVDADEIDRIQGGPFWRLRWRVERWVAIGTKTTYDTSQLKANKEAWENGALQAANPQPMDQGGGGGGPPAFQITIVCGAGAGTGTPKGGPDPKRVSDTKQNSEILRENMNKAGTKSPTWSNAAHHIVPATDKRAELARQILQKFGIAINDAENGVFLRTGAEGKGALHVGKHSSEYIDKVTEALKKATNRQEALDELNQVRYDLEEGNMKLNNAVDPAAEAAAEDGAAAGGADSAGADTGGGGGDEGGGD
jgi:RHS repeat-associated protein